MVGRSRVGSLKFLSQTGWAEVNLPSRGQGRALFLSPACPNSGLPTGHGRLDFPGKTRNIEVVQGILDPQKSTLWFNCLQRTHTLFQGSGFSPRKVFFPFSIYCFLALASRIARSTTVPWTTHHSSCLSKEGLVPRGAGGVGPGYAKCLRLLHLFLSLCPVSFSPLLLPSGKFLQLSNVVFNVKCS